MPKSLATRLKRAPVREHTMDENGIIALEMPQRRILSVTQLTRMIRAILEEHFETVWVEGEISNLRVPSSGHFYFTLKDENSQIRAVMFKMQARYLRFQPEDGLQVICWGRISVYEPRGEYQLMVDYMEPSGLGGLQLALEQLKKRLAAEGLFDPARKRPLPFLPKRVGVVTSPTGAAIQDILTVIRRRFPVMNVLLAPVAVQGEGAAQEIAEAIADLNRMDMVDVIIVGRGGGSIEDLWSFNEEVVARAIVASAIPVVSAVGHEIDYTIADFVADARAPTPSAAAELVVPSYRDLVTRLQELQGHIENSFRKILVDAGKGLEEMSGRLQDPRRRMSDIRLRVDDAALRIHHAVQRGMAPRRNRWEFSWQALLARDPRRTMAEHRHRVFNLSDRLSMRVRELLSRDRAHLEMKMSQIAALSPLQTLHRGYSITRLRATGEVLLDAGRVAPGKEIDVRLQHGSLYAAVTKVFPNGK